ncbi:MAG: hypothetical protein LBQ66_01775 [Planctomycetaceae bacterium]|jgi:predicted amidohydrolase|nr:hypothetical protein [Planctomycetaceae bacterium]
MRIVAVSLNQKLFDWNRNVDNILCAIDWAYRHDVMVIAFPELCLTGVGFSENFKRQEMLDKSLDVFFKLMPNLKNLITVIGLPVVYEDHVFNAACLVVDGKPIGFQCKTRFNSLAEYNFFTPWKRDRYVQIELRGESYKFGDLSFEFNYFEFAQNNTNNTANDTAQKDNNKSTTDDKKANDKNANDKSTDNKNADNKSVNDKSADDKGGADKKSDDKRDGSTFHVVVEIGEPDWLNPVAPNADGRQKVDLLFNPASSRFEFGKAAKRIEYAKRVTQNHSYTHIFSNYIGNGHGQVVYDGGSFIAEHGNVLASTPRFSYHDIQTVVAVTGVDAPYQLLPTMSKEEELMRVVPFAMLDHLRKTETRGFVLPLNGKIEETAVAVITMLGVCFAWEELGRENFVREFGFIAKIENAESPKDAVKEILTCLYQRTHKGYEVAGKRVRDIVQEIGAEFLEVDIDEIIDGYKTIASNASGQELSCAKSAAVLEKLVSYVQEPVVKLIADIRGKTLLVNATKNDNTNTQNDNKTKDDVPTYSVPVDGVDGVLLRQCLMWICSNGITIGNERIKCPFLENIF